MKFQAIVALALVPATWGQSAQTGSFKLRGTSQQIMTANPGSIAEPVLSNVWADETVCDASTWDVTKTVGSNNVPSGATYDYPATRSGLQQAIDDAVALRQSSDKSTWIKVHVGEVIVNSGVTADVFLRDSSTYAGTKYIKISSDNQGRAGIRAGDWGIGTVSRDASGTVTVTTLDAHPFTAGKIVYIDRVADWTFNGFYRLASVPNSTTFTYSQSSLNGIRWPAPAVSSSSGGIVRSQDLSSRQTWIQQHGFVMQLSGVDTKAFKAEYSAHHYCLSDYEARYIDTSVNGNQLSLTGLGPTPHATTDAEMSHHLGMQRAWLHGYDNYQGQGATNTVKGVGANCEYCWVTDSVISQIHYLGKENHGVGINNAHGPLKFVNNLWEGGSQSFFTGGLRPTLPGLPIPGDIGGFEITQNEFSQDLNELNLTGSTCTTNCVNWVRKNRVEFKNATKVAFYGNLLKTSTVGGQSGFILMPQTQGDGSTPGSGEMAGLIDVLIQNNIVAHGAQGVQSGARATQDGVTWGQRRVKWLNNLLYDIGDANRYAGSGLYPIAFQTGATGTTFTNCTAAADATGQYATYTCPGNGTGWTELLILPGDPVLAWGCSGAAYGQANSFNTGTSVAGPVLGPVATAATDPLSLSVTIALAVTPNSTATGCSVSNRQALPLNLQWIHNTVVGSRLKWPYNPSSTGPNFAVNNRFRDNLVLFNGVGTTDGFICQAINLEGSATGRSGDCWDESTLEFYSNVLQGRNSSRYADWPAGAKANLYPANMTCTGAPDGSCIGLKGNFQYFDPDAGGRVIGFSSNGTNATVTTEYMHGLSAGQMVIELYEDTQLTGESGVYAVTSVSPDGLSYTRAASSTLTRTGTGGAEGMALGFAWTGRDFHDFALCHTGEAGCAGGSYFAADGAGQASDAADQGADVNAIYAAWRGRGYPH